MCCCIQRQMGVGGAWVFMLMFQHKAWNCCGGVREGQAQRFSDSLFLFNLQPAFLNMPPFPLHLPSPHEPSILSLCPPPCCPWLVFWSAFSGTCFWVYPHSPSVSAAFLDWSAQAHVRTAVIYLDKYRAAWLKLSIQFSLGWWTCLFAYLHFKRRLSFQIWPCKC